MATAQAGVEDRLDEPINHKRIKRLLRENVLGQERCLPKHTPSPIDRTLRENSSSVNLVRGREFGPMEALVTDFTQLAYDTDERAWFMAIQDKVSKFVLGWALGPSANTDLALQCWDRSTRSLSALELDTAGRIVHSDQDSVFKSRRWLTRLLRDDSVRKSYSERGCKGNSWIESTWSPVTVERREQIEAIDEMAGLRAFFPDYIPYYPVLPPRTTTLSDRKPTADRRAH